MIEAASSYRRNFGERLGLEAGSHLLLLDTPQGVVLATRQQVKALVRRDLEGTSLVEDLLADRRRASDKEDSI